MAKTGLIYHQNAIGHEINESLANHDVKDREIFCKKLHTIKEPTIEDCQNCPYMAGWMMGNGHECAWEDVLDGTDVDTRYIPYSDARKEMLRVSELIDAGIIKKG